MGKKDNLFFGIFLFVLGLALIVRVYILGNGLDNAFWDHVLLVGLAIISGWGGALIWSKK